MHRALGHPLALKAARQNRLDLISQCTGQLMARMQAAGAIGLANANILRRPQTSRAVVESSNHVAARPLRAGRGLHRGPAPHR